MTRQKRARERAEAEARAEAVEEDDMRRFRAAPPPPGPWQAPALTSLRFLMSAQAFLMIMLMLLVVAIVSSEMDAADRAPDRSRQRLDMQKHIGAMTERDFARYYRVDRQSFADIVEMITPPLPELRKRRKRGRKSSGGFVEFDLRLSMALRYLAGGSYLDIMYLHGVSRSTCYKHIFGTLKAMDMALPEFTLDEDIHSLERCRALTATFAAKTDEYIQGAIAAWDGIIFKVEKPTQLNKSKVPNPNKFHCRKGYPGVSVQAACDGNRRFLYMGRCIWPWTLLQAATMHVLSVVARLDGAPCSTWSSSTVRSCARRTQSTCIRLASSFLPMMHTRAVARTASSAHGQLRATGGGVMPSTTTRAAGGLTSSAHSACWLGNFWCLHVPWGWTSTSAARRCASR